MIKSNKSQIKIIRGREGGWRGTQKTQHQNNPKCIKKNKKIHQSKVERERERERERESIMDQIDQSKQKWTEVD